ncbi:MAG: hypothetical protein LBC41_16355, partial [Clostridiales bacterium]|nr:hypothetical protein [Clostridiales bacterium]
MVSLCISGGNQWLYRVADVAADNALLPLRIEKSSQMFEKLLCTPDMSMPKNTLDFWEWDADGFRRYAMPSQIRLRWIEVVKRSVNSAGGDRSRDFKARIQEGLKGAFPDDHDYLLEVESQAGKITCVYLKAENLEKRDNLTFLRTGIYSLDVYEIPDSDVAEIKKSYLPDFSKSCYLRLDLPRKARTIFVRDPSETARLAILKRLDECAQGLSQNGKNLVREFLSDRQNSTIIDAIAQECGCSCEEAEFLFNELASNSQKYFAPDDFASDLMLRIIGYNSEAAEKFKAAIAEKWETENREKIREAEEARSRLENDLGSLGELKNAGLQEQERLSIQLAELKAQISGLEDRRVFLTQQNQQALQTQQALQNQQAQWVQPQLQPQLVDQTAMLENMGEIIAKYAQLATREAAPTREETQTDTPSGFEE